MNMDEMQAWYRGFLRTRIEALESARAALGAGDAEAGDSIRRLVHSLKGSGGMYGYPAISERAAIVEKIPDEALVAELDQLLTLLRDVADSGRGEHERTILIVDDDPAVLHFVTALLSGAGRRVVGAASIAEAEERLREDDVALVLLDLVLPDGDGRRLLMRLRSRTHTANVPVIVLTSRHSAAARAECLALGADDVLAKPFDPETLPLLVANRLERAEHALRESRIDLLTSLPNRVAFRESCERALERAAGRGGADAIGVVAMIDIDRFKHLNDTYGHATGDTVLQLFAARVRENLGDGAVVARWGGEEFVVLFPDADIDHCPGKLDGARDAVARAPFHAVDGRVFHVTFSAGAAPWTRPAHDVPTPAYPPGASFGHESLPGFDEALAEADRRLYAAKRLGRNRIVASAADVAGRRPRILVVASGLPDEDARVARALAAAEAEVTLVADITQARETEPERHDLAVVSFSDGQSTDTEVLGELVRRLPPLLVITPAGSDKSAYRALERGAADFLISPYTDADLVSRVLRLASQSHQGSGTHASRETGAKNEVDARPGEVRRT